VKFAALGRAGDDEDFWPPMPERATLAGDSRKLRVLYICYLSLEDPLVLTQVVAYLTGLVTLGHTVHLLTFETAALTRRRRRDVRATLAAKGIAWYGLRYHKRPTLLATGLDVGCGAAYATWLVRRHRLDAIHARNHVPAAMALIAERLVRFRLIFDLRGLMAEEYEDAGRWRRGSLPFRATKAVEKRALSRAAAIIVLTERVRRFLDGSSSWNNMHVIPCCADVEEIAAAVSRRTETRRKLALEGRRVLIYVGKFTGWYMEREMVKFFALARDMLPDMHFLIVTQSDSELIESEFTRLALSPSTMTVTRCPPSEMGAYLAAADAAIAFIRPSFSKISSSPTKVGEYLAAGLPMICTSGIGDVDELIGEYRVGISLTNWDHPALVLGAQQLGRLMTDKGLPERARKAAREHLSLAKRGIPAYDAVYRQVAGRGPSDELKRPLDNDNLGRAR
jgi:glycosyltransferase involved in cell wall biosynthesis